MGEKFKEKHPKLSQFIENKLPQAGNIVGSLLPDQGGLGIIKKLITSSPDLSAEDRAEGARLLLDAQEQVFKDIADSRAREIAIVTSDKAPLINKIIQPLLAILILGSCFLFWYFMLFTAVPKEKEVMIAGVTGSLTTLSMGVVGYYFGSSTGSKSKQDQINKMMEG